MIKFFKSSKLYSITFYFIFLIIITLYSLELLLIFFLKELDYKHLLKLRLNAYKEAISSESIALSNTPGLLGEKYIFGGYPNIKTLYCKESTEEFIFYNSDRYGFNNDDNLWDNKIDIFLIGDSFAKGACVSREDNIASKLSSTLNKKIINLGMDGSGPLEQYASFLEYSGNYEFQLLIWTFTGSNDFVDFAQNKENLKLIKYLTDKKFRQDLVKNKNDIEKNFKIQKLKFDENIKNFSYNEKYNNLKNFLSLKQLKPILKYQVLNRINLSNFNNNAKKKDNVDISKNTNKKKYSENLEKPLDILTIKKIFTEINKLSLERNFKLLIVYNPEFSFKSNPVQYTRFKEIMKDLNLDFIDLKREFLLRNINHIDLLTFKNAHFSTVGYGVISEILYKQIMPILK